MEVAALIVSIVALVVSVSSTWYARRAAQASVKSAIAASTTATLELDRRHAERTPHLRITCELNIPYSTHLTLTVFLVGPPELDQLDELIVTIRDDHPWRHPSLMRSGTSAEQLRTQIWAPFRFVPGTGPGADPISGVPGADRTGRSTPTTGLPVGEELPFVLEPTAPPPWSNQTVQDWRQERGPVLRLRFECHKAGTDRPWILSGEINTQADTSVEVPTPGSGLNG